MIDLLCAVSFSHKKKRGACLLIKKIDAFLLNIKKILNYQHLSFQNDQPV